MAKERVLLTRWEGEEDWNEWKDHDLALEEWEIDTVFKAEYKVIEREIKA